ncbi:uncharacterized protein LOC121643277 [Melanotaenia boesemani]|uniref:uncharacterized protein LOC121643277 n=1 Tax=Melanotaenia boesemani TaxID=1250792 RepID=UPI001C03B204|nr:uncharacterized protein LOC121643277 [Melanotaenia boesemani]
MLHLWVILVILHQADSLISEIKAQFGEPVTLTCLYPELEYSNTRIKWYKQSIGDTLTLITTMMKATATPIFEQGFSPARFGANCSTVMSTLTIVKMMPEDEALYHCAVSTWKVDQWTGIHLSLKEKSRRKSEYTVVQWPTSSGAVQPGDSVILQCSVLSDSLQPSCPDEHCVHWFAIRADKSLGDIMYTNGNASYQCDQKPDRPAPSKSCVYHFSKNLTSSDSGTYYCALATCGEIIFGNGTKVDVAEASGYSCDGYQINGISLLSLCVILASCVLLIAVLLPIMKRTKCDSCNTAMFLQNNVGEKHLKREEDMWIYSTAVFAVIKTDSGGKRNTKAVERQQICAAFAEE